jgi:UDP-N-acetylglucosamine 2-epimerase (non-hydrolysing)
MKILNVAGARPNFMKLAPLIRRMQKHPEISALLVHTGQHYDANMAGQFFRDLELPPPHASLEVGSGSHANQTADVMKRLEPVLEEVRPDLVLVVGDVNSTLAAALTATKLQIPVAHVEAGLRSHDRTMPEEINRLLTDAIADYLFVTEESGRDNLLHEGVDPRKIHFVGNVMIDALEDYRPLWEASAIHHRLGLRQGQYGVVTLHRPSNVDDARTLQDLIDALRQVARQIPIIFPVHPRTMKRLAAWNGSGAFPRLDAQSPTVTATGLSCIDPLGYPDFMALVAGARLVLTDSGGLQEETTALGVPCLTLRENTERPVTVTHGTNRIIGTSSARIVEEALQVLRNPREAPARPPLWDGKAAERIVTILARYAKAPDTTSAEKEG